MNELADLLGGGKTAATTYDPVDAAIRTVIAEERDPEARQWVAGVIRNRAKAKNGDLLAVVREKGQFEPWANEREKIASIDPNSDDYKKTAALVGPILRGEADDPSGGATHFYAPAAQKELSKQDGRPEKADFDDGTGVMKGSTLFFHKGDGAPPTGGELASLLGGAPSPDAPATPDTADAEFAAQFGDPSKLVDGDTRFTKFTGSDSKGTPEQTKTFQALDKGFQLNKDKPLGSKENPYGIQPGLTEKDVPQGAYYVPAKGGLFRAPGGEEKSSLTTGAIQGAQDVALSAFNMLPGNSEIRDRLEADQMGYDADYKGDPKSGLGRFTGQLAAAALPIAGAEAAAAPLLAGRLVGGGILGAGARLVGRGAAEGGGGAALTFSANDAPLGDQVRNGMIAGAILGPLVPAVGRTAVGSAKAVRGGLEKFTHTGREKAVSRIINEVAPAGVTLDTRELVPGSFPTMGEAAGDAGIASLERNARTNPKLVQVFQERLDQNANARREFFEKVAKDPEAIADAEGARETATTALREQAFKGAGKADPAAALAKVDEILKGPAGQRDVVVKALTNIRGKLDAEGVPQTDVEQLYGIRKSIGDMLSPLASNEAKGAQLATHELMQVKGEIDKAIEAAAPGFKGYLKTYEEMSRPIDEMKLLQGMKLTDQHGNITLAKINSVIDKVEAKRAGPGANKEKSVSKETLEALKALQADLKRASNIMKGRAPGSDTRQNLVMDKFAQGEGIPLGARAVLGAKIPGAGMLLGAADKAVAAQNEKMLGQLSSRLLSPERLPAGGQTAARGSRKPRLPVSKVAIPVGAGIGANAIAGRQ